MRMAITPSLNASRRFVFVRWNVTRALSILGEVRLDEFRTGVDVDLAQERVAGVNESMRNVRRNDDDATRFHLALFVADRDGGAAFERECDFNVRMLM